MATEHVAKLTERLITGDRRALAKAITHVEGRLEGWQDIMRAVFPRAGRAFVIGITGSPGAGKSTLVAALSKLMRAQGHKVAVLAVDPSSPFSGGAVLGDRTRLQQGSVDSGLFFRSLASRGAVGALSDALSDCIQLLDAAGWRNIIVETVGAGQSEIAIHREADVTVVVLTPNMGDDVQAAKAGILEIGDIFVINKSDLPGSERMTRYIREQFPHRPIVRTVAIRGEGMDELLQQLTSEQFSSRNAEQNDRRQSEKAEKLLMEGLHHWLVNTVRRRAEEMSYWSTAVSAIRSGDSTPHEQAEKLIAACLTHLMTEIPVGNPNGGQKADEVPKQT